MNWETLLCLGDSITFGARSYLGYPEICGCLLEDKLSKNWNVINHATNGFTTIDLVRSIDKESVTLKENYPSIITIMIGTNDVKNNTNVKDFERAYRQLIVKAKLMSINSNIVLLKIPEITKKVFYPYNFDMNSTVEVFNEIIEGIAKKQGLRVWKLELDEDDFYDGVHFSANGSETAGRQLASFILKDKGVESSADLS